MLNKLQEKPGWQLLTLVVLVSFIFNYYASAILTKSYEASQFPVPYFEAQLSFSAVKIMTWYEFLVQNNTMDIYVTTQNIDFLFMLSVLLLHVSAILLLSRGFALGSKLRKYLVYAALISASAPIFDALENAVSYVMIANYNTFPAWLAILYSSFAAAKFAMFTFAYIVLALGIGMWVIVRIKNVIGNTNKSTINTTG